VQTGHHPAPSVDCRLLFDESALLFLVRLDLVRALVRLAVGGVAVVVADPTDPPRLMMLFVLLLM
jgi:hypothetical protein